MRRSSFVHLAGRVAALLGVAVLPALAAAPVQAQEAPTKREFRGAWIATVTNIDWPVLGVGAAAQKAGLVTILDRLKAAGTNAVMFQVRPESDALYRSDIEPWSYWLTGTQGRDPGFDPLAFAIDEAHKRGMELHAWMNPYRTEQLSGRYTTAANHVSRQHPDWVLAKGNLRTLNPGRPEVRDYVARVVSDVVRRYDIDAVHFDDYFYFEGIANEDAAQFQQYGGGMAIADWRRDNVNRLVAQVNDSIRVIKPRVKFGISPSGIRRNADANTRGFESYSQIYADGLAWLTAKTIDYIVPQVYWYIGKPAADYAAVVPWWASVATERHFYVGHPSYKIGTREDATTLNHLYTAADIGQQIRFNRARANVRGSVMYNATSVVSGTNGRDGVADTLRRYWAPPAFPPVMSWKETTAPNAPTALRQSGAASGTRVTLAWTAPAPAADGDTARFYALYRFTAPPTGTAAPETAENLVAVFGGSLTTYTDDAPRTSGVSYHYVLTALDANWNESAPSTAAVSTDAVRDAAAPASDAAVSVTPSPARGAVTVHYRLPANSGEARVEIYDALGRRVAAFAAEAGGERQTVWEADVAPGVYIVRASAGSASATTRLVVAR